MRILLSDGNASESNGIYTFSLDKRPSNATTVRVKKADFQYTVPPGSVAPHVVYMRSTALHNAARNKHSAILKARAGQPAKLSRGFITLPELLRVTPIAF